MRTRKTIEIPRTEFSAVGTGLRSHIRTDKVNSLSFSFSLVLDEALQLVETPAIEPSVQSFTHKLVPALSYSFKVLQNDCISRGNNILTDFVVDCSYITFLPSRNSFKLSSGRLCAFTLQSFPQIIMLHNSGLMTFEHLAIRSDSKVIYSDINPNYFLVATRSSGVDISGECDMKEQSTFSVFYNFKRLVSPVKIFPVILGNAYSNIFSLSWSKSGNSNLFKAKSEKVSIEADRTGLHNRLLFKLNSFKVFRSFGNSFTGKIGREPLSQIFIDKMMELKPIAYLSFKSFVDSILNSLKKCITHIKQSLFMLNFQLYSRNEFHNNAIKHNIYLKLSEVTGQIHPTG